jgi:hypothetical protein
MTFPMAFARMHAVLEFGFQERIGKTETTHRTEPMTREVGRTRSQKLASTDRIEPDRTNEMCANLLEFDIFLKKCR